jgi:hypothetical protein
MISFRLQACVSISVTNSKQKVDRNMSSSALGDNPVMTGFTERLVEEIRSTPGVCLSPTDGRATFGGTALPSIVTNSLGQQVGNIPPAYVPTPVPGAQGS